MKKTTWRSWHKWIGLFFCFFLLMFCISGILINHRNFFSDYSLSRKYLPSLFHYKGWDQGLMRGTLRHEDRVLIYGNSGIWSADSLGRNVRDFNQGLPESADRRNVRAVVQTRSGSCFAVTLFGLFHLPQTSKRWQAVTLPEGDERFTDLTMHGDTLVVVGRSFLYTATAPYQHFSRITLPKALDDNGSVSLFRTVWMLHSGEVFGLPGKLLMDAVAVVLIVLSLTGIAHWLFPKWLKRQHNVATKRKTARWMTTNLKWHDKLGRITLVFTLFSVITGWALRPPVLLALVNFSVPPIPYSTLDNSNPWNDRLRMLRYDDEMGDWLLSTNSGFYKLTDFHSIPTRVADAPPVSVMGLNVFERANSGGWVIGSFNGLYRWQRSNDWTVDYMSGERIVKVSHSPFGKLAVGGFSQDFRNRNGSIRPCIVQHYGGTTAIAQPAAFAHLPMSLWNIALELHNGRLYTFLVEPALFFVFVSGIFVLLILWSGWKIRKRRNSKHNVPTHIPTQRT